MNVHGLDNSDKFSRTRVCVSVGLSVEVRVKVKRISSSTGVTESST